MFQVLGLGTPPLENFYFSGWVGLGYDAATNDCEVIFVSVEANCSSSSSPEPS